MSVTAVLLQLAGASALSSLYISDVNRVPLADGCVMHLGLKQGQLAQRIVSVGSLSRAQTIRQSFDDPDAAFELTSNRGFTTFTGTMHGVPVSVVATGMGFPMMDFFVREARAVTEGPLVIVRYGSCGGLSDVEPGCVVLNTPGSVAVRRNYDAFGQGETSADPYMISQPVLPDPKVAASVCERLTAALGDSRVVEGLNLSCDSFYSSQGRIDEHFEDKNGALLDQVSSLEAISMEMESFQLLHLAACSKGSIRACTSAIIAASRLSGAAITNDMLLETEKVGGRAILEAVAQVEID